MIKTFSLFRKYFKFRLQDECLIHLVIVKYKSKYKIQNSLIVLSTSITKCSINDTKNINTKSIDTKYTVAIFDEHKDKIMSLY